MDSRLDTLEDPFEDTHTEGLFSVTTYDKHVDSYVEKHAENHVDNHVDNHANAGGSCRRTKGRAVERHVLL